MKQLGWWSTETAGPEPVPSPAWAAWHGWALKQTENRECERAEQGLGSAGSKASQQIPVWSHRGGGMSSDSSCSVIRAVRIEQMHTQAWPRCLTMPSMGMCFVWASALPELCLVLLSCSRPDGSSSMQNMFGPTAVLSQKPIFSLAFSLSRCSQPTEKPKSWRAVSTWRNQWNPKPDVLLAEEDQLFYTLCVCPGQEVCDLEKSNQRACSQTVLLRSLPMLHL